LLSSNKLWIYFFTFNIRFVEISNYVHMMDSVWEFSQQLNSLVNEIEKCLGGTVVIHKRWDESFSHHEIIIEKVEMALIVEEILVYTLLH
jgi:hypothetical protein